MGPVTPIGIGKAALWSGLQAERSGIGALTRFQIAGCKARCAAEIHSFDANTWFAPHETKRWDRCTQFAMVAAKLALGDAGLDLSGDLHPRIGISFGSALGGIADAEAHHAKFLAEGIKTVPRALALQIYGGATHSNMGIHFGLQGPATTHSNSCASGNVALGDALRLIREGLADVVLAGAAESPLSPLTFSSFDLIHTMSRWQGEPAAQACRPFDEKRDGFVMGEGAACFVVESYEHAAKRGARIYAELAGFSLVSEAHHMTIPRPDGEPLRRAMQTALDDAGVNASEVNYVNAHASSTPQNDANEAAQIAAIFGPDAPPVSGTKAFTGHALGAAGAMECAITLLAMEHGWLPPTLHLASSDCAPLDFVPNHGREASLKMTVSNSFGFGGIDASLVLRRV
ncbi:beta-ketoacyl-[acyl-carrier-protein] synthase II [Verrucomicrobiaceae bacterium SCGC AG-212-N21]|nr:beta-ketoacyl-[acyl-carrier-protein] synthase II [Verrucomicrobiaceae bacterium SCGC AG-212-N21]